MPKRGLSFFCSIFSNTGSRLPAWATVRFAHRWKASRLEWHISLWWSRTIRLLSKSAAVLLTLDQCIPGMLSEKNKAPKAVDSRSNFRIAVSAFISPGWSCTSTFPSSTEHSRYWYYRRTLIGTHVRKGSNQQRRSRSTTIFYHIFVLSSELYLYLCLM